MEKRSLTALGREQLAAAKAAGNGRSAHTVYGGHERSLRQTLMALATKSGPPCGVWSVGDLTELLAARCAVLGSVLIREPAAEWRLRQPR